VVDGLDQAAPLRHPEEAARRHDLAVLADQPDQQLLLDALAGRQVDDRLGEDAEAVAGQRRLDALGPRDVVKLGAAARLLAAAL
jgi:hypothetical protein